MKIAERQRLFNETASQLVKLINKRNEKEAELANLKDRYITHREEEIKEINEKIRELTAPFIGEQFILQNGYKVKQGADYERVHVDTKILKSEFADVYNKVITKSITKGRLTITPPKNDRLV